MKKKNNIFHWNRFNLIVFIFLSLLVVYLVDLYMDINIIKSNILPILLLLPITASFYIFGLNSKLKLINSNYLSLAERLELKYVLKRIKKFNYLVFLLILMLGILIIVIKVFQFEVIYYGHLVVFSTVFSILSMIASLRESIYLEDYNQYIEQRHIQRQEKIELRKKLSNK